MVRFLKGHIEYLAQHLQPAKCIPKEQNVIIKPTPGKVWTYHRQSVRKYRIDDQSSTSNVSALCLRKNTTMRVLIMKLLQRLAVHFLNLAKIF